MRFVTDQILISKHESASLSNADNKTEKLSIESELSRDKRDWHLSFAKHNRFVSSFATNALSRRLPSRLHY